MPVSIIETGRHGLTIPQQPDRRVKNTTPADSRSTEAETNKALLR
jgi:hypothetical protein